MNWKIYWWICVVLFSIFILTDSGAAGCRADHRTTTAPSGASYGN